MGKSTALYRLKFGIFIIYVCIYIYIYIYIYIIKIPNYIYSSFE